MRLIPPAHLQRLMRLQTLLGMACRSVVLLAGLVAFFQGETWADSINGYADLIYAVGDDKTEIGPLSSETKNRLFQQRYSLTLTKELYPNLLFSASGVFDQTQAKNTTSDGVDTDTRVTLIRPYLDLKWGAYPFSADLSYYRTQTETNASGFQKTTLISESYQGRLGWRPADLPLLDLFLSRTNTFDEARTFNNTVADQISWTSQYSFRDLNFRYYGSYIDNQDKLRNNEVTILSNDLRTDYTKSLFNGRANFFGFYEFSNSQLDISAKGGGGTTVNIPVPPFQGLSSLTNTPDFGALLPNPFLVDFNTVQSAAINIGVPTELPPVTTPRNIGIDFLAATSVNTLFVWIDRDQLPDVIANSYKWAVYSSTDNTSWTLITQQASATFIQLANHFEINFPDVTARYVKVVVSPLSPAVAAFVPSFPDPDKIFVTEIQAFTRQTSSKSSSRSLSSTTQRVNTDLRILLLERPELYYDVSYALTTANSGGISSPAIWTLSNMLGFTQPLSSIFTARANISRQDNKDVRGKTVNYVWSAAIDAVPLSTLSQNLTYSGNRLQQSEGTSTGHTLYFSNTAQLYTDVSVFLNIGAFVTSDSTGRDNKGSSLNYGVTVNPTRKLSVTVSGGFNNSRQSGGGLPGISTTDKSTDIALSYTPFPSLYFYADWGWQESNFLQNYQVNWSPFQGGDLQFSFYYNEVLNQLNNSKDRLIRPYLRLDLKKAGYLTLSYSIIKSSANSPIGAIQQKLQETQKVGAVEYRWNF